MMAEEAVIQGLTERFEVLKGKCGVTRDRRITAEVPREVFMEVVKYARKVLSYNMLLTITGLDLGEKLEAIYHLADEYGVVLNLKLDVPKDDPVIESVFPVYESVTYYERELQDLLGFQVNGLAPGKRYPLPDCWPEGNYPLRKDWRENQE